MIAGSFVTDFHDLIFLLIRIFLLFTLIVNYHNLVLVVYYHNLIFIVHHYHLVPIPTLDYKLKLGIFFALFFICHQLYLGLYTDIDVRLHNMLATSS